MKLAHMDLTSSKILLQNKYSPVAKIGDLGLASCIIEERFRQCNVLVLASKGMFYLLARKSITVLQFLRFSQPCCHARLHCNQLRLQYNGAVADENFVSSFLLP